jgi:hypothetical protein
MHELMCIVLSAVVIALCRAIRVVCLHDVARVTSLPHEPSENCRKAFKASGIVPINAQVVLDRLEVRLRTPPEPLLQETPWYSRLDESPVYYAAAALHPYFVGSRASCVEAAVKTNDERRMSYLVEDQSQLICLQDLDASNEAQPCIQRDCPLWRPGPIEPKIDIISGPMGSQTSGRTYSSSTELLNNLTALPLHRP